MSVQRKNGVAGQKCKQNYRVKIGYMVRNIDGFAGHILFIKGYVAFDLHKSEKISKAKSYEVSQNKVSGLFK